MKDEGLAEKIKIQPILKLDQKWSELKDNPDLLKQWETKSVLEVAQGTREVALRSIRYAFAMGVFGKDDEYRDKRFRLITEPSVLGEGADADLAVQFRLEPTSDMDLKTFLGIVNMFQEAANKFPLEAEEKSVDDPGASIKIGDGLGESIKLL